MRVLLVGSPPSARGCARRLNGSMDVAGEFDSLAAARAAEIDQRRRFSSRPTWPTRRPDEDGFDEPLTPREVQVLELLAEGLPNKAIAAPLAHQRSDGEVSRLVDLGQARRDEPHRRRPPRGPARADHALTADLKACATSD